MAEFDLKQALVDMGVDEVTADGLKARMQGGDYVNLVNALNVQNIAQSLNQAQKILSKYGVKLNGSAPMAEDTSYLKSLFDSYKSGPSIEETIGEWLQPINESTHGDYTQLRSRGYDYQANVPTDIVEGMIDWLDANQIEYLTDGNHFQMKCGGPETQFRISRKINELFDKAEARGTHEIETMRESKSAKKREAAAKEKLANLKPKNPVVQAMATRSGGGVHKQAEDPRKADKYGRGAKHRKDPMDESYEIDETIVIEDDSVETISEGVIGMTPMNPLLRLRELAGMAPAPSAPPGIEAEATPAEPVNPSAIEDEVTEVPAVADFGDEPVVPGMESDPVADLESDLDIAPAASLASDPTNGGMPGDLPPVGGMDAIATPQSEAMGQIEDALNGIQRQLADIRLSEYKTVMRKLQDLTNQVQMMGRDYLGERRRK